MPCHWLASRAPGLDDHGGACGQWAQVAPVRNPLRALGAFSRFWETMVVFYDGEYVPNGAVSRFYIPKWFALTMPETYAVAARS